MTPESLVRATDNLFSLPDVVLRVNQLIDEPSTRPADLAEVILCDPGLSARLLRVVNSAFYARPKPVETVSQAIGLIGFRALRDLIMATAAVDLFKGLPPEKVNMEHFWMHGIACGIAARDLAGRRGLRNGERLFLAGLLHGLGRLVFFSQCADAYREVLRLVEQEQLDSVAAEERVFGFNHVELGAELLRAWRFPESIWKVVAARLDPALAGEYEVEAEILHAAERVARQVAATAIDTGETASHDASDVLKALAERWSLAPDALLELPREISLQTFEVFEILVPGSTLVY